MKRRRIPTVAVMWAALFSTLLLQPLGGRGAEAAMPQSESAAHGQTAETAQPDWQSPVLRTKIEPSLLKQVAEGNPGDHYRFVVELADQADLTALPRRPTRVDRQHQVVTALQTTARQSQAGLVALLQAQQANGQVQHFRPFWIFNGLAVTADADTLLALAARSEVRIMRQDRWRRWLSPGPTAENLPAATVVSAAWNIARVRADLVWGNLRLDGSGVTVAILDTGVDWQHPALRAQYRGYKPGGLVIHQGNWTCTTDEGYLYPVDGFGHGTHVTGLAVGHQDDIDQAIGVAPGARWIAAKMLNDAGYGYDSWIHAAFEWVMAPAGDPALAPAAVNGSWGIAGARNETFRADLQALRAAGIVAVFAAGNDGPNAGSIQSPGSYPEVLTVGATDDIDQVTSFSGRGPSPWDEIKPEVVAPGAQVRSSLPGGTYGLHNGTSMAAPHVTGMVALLLQADPTLTVDQIEEIITSTARPLAEHAPNNDTGWGQIDTYQAAAVALEAGFVTGQVRRHTDGEPLPTAQITAYDTLGQRQATVQANDAGHYHIALVAGLYSLSAEAFGYAPQRAADVLVQGTLTTTVDLTLSSSPAGVLWGEVHKAGTGVPVGAELSATGTPAHTTSDPQTGQYRLALPAGSYTLDVTQNGCRRHTTENIEIVANEDTRLDVALTPAPTLLLVDSGRWYYDSQASYFSQALDDNDYVYDLWEIRELTTDLPDLDALSPYQITLWSSPLDAPGLIGAGQTISNYLETGGRLFLSGQDVGYWDSGLEGHSPQAYYRKMLKAQIVADDAGRDNLVGLPGEILQGLSLTMNGPDSARNQVYPDAIALLEPRDAAIIGRYAENGDAALQAIGCQSYRAVYLAAGLEGLGDRAKRAEVVDRALTWLDTPHPTVGIELYPPRQDQVWLTGRTLTYTVELRNTGQAADRFALNLSPSAWSTSVWDAAFSQPITQSLTLGTCQTQTLGLKVTVPPSVAWNATDAVTLTAHSLSDPSRAAQASFHSKTPAPILLVNDHRWYDPLEDYRAALEANQYPYDIWRITPGPNRDDGSPSVQRLQRYPLVIWFTAYDWYASVTPNDERRLAAYLDGGGRLLLSSQDYLSTDAPTDFGREYLGVANYTSNLTATQIVGAVDSPVGSEFGSLNLTFPFRNRSDALRMTPAAQPAFWGQHSQPVALTREHSPWKTTFFALPLEALSAEKMAEVLGRSVAWLSALGDSSLSVEQPVAAGGDQLAYTLWMRNTGPALLSSVSLSNTVPAATTYVPGSLEGAAEYDPAQDRFTWNGTLAPGETITVGYRLQLDGALLPRTTVRNVAHLRDESGIGIERVATSRVGTPDLTGSVKIASTQIARTAQVLTYTLILQNDGRHSAQAHLADPIPEQTGYVPGTARASSGLLTSTTETLWWTVPISIGQAVTLTFPVMISPTGAARYILNRASLDDGWGGTQPLEAYTWVKAHVFLPLVLKYQ